MQGQAGHSETWANNRSKGMVIIASVQLPQRPSFVAQSMRSSPGPGRRVSRTEQVQFAIFTRNISSQKAIRLH
ncbi:hypothetical protein FDU21_04590 [Xanthomonas oryzae pv. oryzae]|nr:hypothetical protein FDU21_04590 [Xanthomonas oryzae pv. oryzae]